MDSIVVGNKSGVSIPERLWEEARDIFFQDLGQAKRAKLDDTTRLEDTIKSLKLAQSKVSNEYGTHTLRVGGKDVDIKVGRIMKRLELILQVGDAAMQFGPETVSLVWSAFRMVFTGFLKDSQICASLFDAIDQTSDILFVCQVYANHYSRERVEMNDFKNAGDRVLKQIPPVYASVLKFSYQTRKLVSDHGKVGRTLIGVFGGEFEELTKTVDNAKEKRDTLQRTADVAFQVAAIGLLENDSKVLGDVHETINATIIPDLKGIQVELVKNREHQVKKDLEKAYEEQKAWLLAGTSAELQAPERQYLANIKHRHPETCRWVLGTPQYEAWRNGEDPSLLRLSGEGGYGKSYLVSTIIEDLNSYIQQCPGSKPQLVYFFCKTGDNATQYGAKIMLHLVTQLFTACGDQAREGNEKLSDENVKCQNLVEVVKKARDKIKSSEGKKDSSLLQINSVLQPMLTNLAEITKTGLFIVVDALDECSDFTAGLLDAFKTLPESGLDIRVLVSSRPEERILLEMKEVPHREIEVNKETNYADLVAYIEESLKSMPRFRQLNVGPKIARKSDGMFKCMSSPVASSYPVTNRSADANMVIENLKQSKAVRTNVQKLMKRLPEGMNNLYKQKLQRLEEYDREMLLTALRWLMCSEGRIEIALVADDIEHRYEDLASDEDDSDYEDNEDFDSSIESVGASTGLDPHEGNMELEDRESIKTLKTVGRDFLKFSSTVVEIRHQSVRDFINSEENSLPRVAGLCPVCGKHIDQYSIYQASPKHGHLIMVENIFRKLTSPSFQDKYIIIKGHKKDSEGMVDETSLTSIAKLQRSDTLPREGFTNETDTPQPRPDVGLTNQATNETVSQVTVTTELAIEEEAGTVNSLSDLREFAPDEEEPPRYELVQWPRHMRAAEEAWPEAERDAELQKRWEKLYNTVEKFLSSESLVFKSWSKRLALWREKPWDPLHVAANFGLLRVMQRYISYGTNINVLDEDGYTPLHLACYGEVRCADIELLVQHGADVNALTDGKETPLLLLAQYAVSPNSFQYLLDHGAKPEIPDPDGWTCLHHAAAKRNLELCSILLCRTAVDINARDSDDETPLHWMFRFPNASPELVKLFLDHGAEVNGQNKHSEGPLYSACLVGNVSGARLLLEYKADIDDDENVFGKTALHAAVAASSLELVKLLVEKGADVYRQDKQGRDCFLQAADEDEVEILEYLLDTWNSHGSTTRHLLTQDLDGDTPLHRSAISGHDRAVDILLKAGNATTMCLQPNHDGITPLHMGALCGDLHIVEALLTNGADPLARSNRGSSPLDSAFDGWKECYSTSRSGDFAEVCERLARISPDAARKADILDLAIEKGATELSKILAEPTNGTDIHGWTPTMLVNQCGRYEIANFLSQFPYEGTVGKSKHVGNAPLVHSPSRWCIIAKHSQLILSEDGLEVTCPIDSEAWPFPMLVQTDHPIAAGLSRYYYEISVLEAASPLPKIGLGFSSKYVASGIMPGWSGNGAPSWGYHGDDGKKFASSDLGIGKDYSVGYGPGDTVGCGVDFTEGKIFYTRNGILLPTAFEGVGGRLFPVVGMGAQHGPKIRANFGQRADVPFMYQPQ